MEDIKRDNDFNELYKDIDSITKYLENKQDSLDKILLLSRNIIRDSGHVITMIHNNEIKNASISINKISKYILKLKKFENNFKYNTIQAFQEYAEAYIFLNIKKTGKIPKMEDLKINEESYLLGLMDVVGELKREIVGLLMENKIVDAKKLLKIMEAIYDSTRELKFAESVITSFRKKQDVARIQIESAASQILFHSNNVGIESLDKK
jgi:translin